MLRIWRAGMTRRFRGIRVRAETFSPFAPPRGEDVVDVLIPVVGTAALLFGVGRITANYIATTPFVLRRRRAILEPLRLVPIDGPLACVRPALLVWTSSTRSSLADQAEKLDDRLQSRPSVTCQRKNETPIENAG